MSRYKGGIVGLAFLVLFAGFTMIFILILDSVSWADSVVKIHSEVKILKDTEERGSKLVSLLRARQDNIDYEIVLGSMRAKNHPESIDEDLKKTLESLEINLAVYDENGELIKSYGEISSDMECTAIALPAGRTGKVCIS